MVGMLNAGAVVAGPHGEQSEVDRSRHRDREYPLESVVVALGERDLVVTEPEHREALVLQSSLPDHGHFGQRSAALSSEDLFVRALRHDRDVGAETIRKNGELSVQRHVGIPHREAKRFRGSARRAVVGRSVCIRWGGRCAVHN